MTRREPDVDLFIAFQSAFNSGTGMIFQPTTVLVSGGCCHNMSASGLFSVYINSIYKSPIPHFTPIVDVGKRGAYGAY